MVFCRECSKKYVCSKLEKTYNIDCDAFIRDLDFLIDEEEEFLKELEQYEQKIKEKKIKPRTKMSLEEAIRSAEK